jgi:hypothetical protein
MTESPEETEFVLYPRASLPVFLGAGFYLQCSIQVLHLYGGWVRPPLGENDCPPFPQIHADLKHTAANSEVIFYTFHKSPYATFETLLEVIAYVVATSDVHFQASHQRVDYLKVRDQARIKNYLVLCDLFGFGVEKRAEFDRTIVERANLYAQDSVVGMAHFSAALRGQLKSDVFAFTKAAYAYILLAHAEIFGRLLFYTKGLLGSCASSCSKCSQAIRGFRLPGVDKLTCGNCHTVHNIMQTYEQ